MAALELYSLLTADFIYIFCVSFLFILFYFFIIKIKKKSKALVTNGLLIRSNEAIEWLNGLLSIPKNMEKFLRN